MARGHGARDEVLARVRAAVAGGVRHGGGHAGGIDGTQASAPRTQDEDVRIGLLERFVQASEAAGVPVRLAVDVQEARAHVLDILAREGVRAAVVSPNAAEAPWGVGGNPSSTPSQSVPRFLVRQIGCHEPDDELMTVDAGITTAEHGLADTGTLVVLSSAGHNRLDSLVPPLHIALLSASDLLPGLAALFGRLTAEQRFERHAAVTFITGPSRTADIELTLTVGVHGPRKVYVVLLQEPSS